MPEYLSPGVYIQEIDSGPRPIEGVGTACAAFVGFAPAGPANTPMLVTNWTQYVELYGSIDESGRKNPHMPGAYMSHAIYGYFINGGGRCYVTRVVAEPQGRDGAEKSEPLQLPARASKAVNSLTVTAKGTPTENIQVDVSGPTEEGAPEGTFTLKVKMGQVEEEYPNVGVGRRHPRNVAEAVKTSQLIEVVENPSPGPVAERVPEFGTYVLKAAPPVALVQISAAHYTGDAASRSGIEGLEVADDVTMVCCPDLMSAYEMGAIDADGVKAVQTAMIAHCERMQDRMAILDSIPTLAPKDGKKPLAPQEVKRWRERDTNYDSKFAVLYYPWIKVAGPDGRPMAIPPSGHMAGIWARSDNTRGVHKAPANEVILGALEAVTPITKGEQDTLNPIGVNCIRSFTGRGLRVWGARTLSSDPAWRYINVRRLFNYVEKSLERGLQWVVFEPNDPDLWARVRRDITAFLTGVWREGALFGLNPAEAFFVKCDEELNPPDVRDRGQLFIDVGLAPVKPAEFVIFRFSQWAGGGA